MVGMVQAAVEVDALASRDAENSNPGIMYARQIKLNGSPVYAPHYARMTTNTNSFKKKLKAHFYGLTFFAK